VADDDADLLDVTTYALRREGYSTVTATDGPQAVDRWATERPDLVLLDLGLPRMSGFDVCRRIRETATTPIIMLTARTDDENVVQGFLIGADDYVTKPFSHRQLAARIRSVLNRAHGGLTPEPAGSLTVGSLRLEMQSHEVTVRDGRTVRLTPLEFRLLYMLAINEGRVVSSSRLVEYAWGYEGGEGSLVKTHISHMRQKLGLDKDRAGAEQPDDVHISTIPWVGYSLRRVREGSASSISAGV
jgi:two-component system, OmpR family, response regulator MtrA